MSTIARVWFFFFFFFRAWGNSRVHSERPRPEVASGVWTAEQAVQDAGWLWQLLRVWDANKLSFVTAQGPEQCVFERISRREKTLVGVLVEGGGGCGRQDSESEMDFCES